jgi:bacterioferritin
MKPNKDLINSLKSLLKDGLTTVNKYMVHSEMCENLGYERLHKAIQKLAMDEMLHAEWLIERILFLDDATALSKLSDVLIGRTVSELITNENGEELNSICAYQNAINLAIAASDSGTANLLDKMLKVEEKHLHWARLQRAQIEQMGLDNYLINQEESLAYN